MRLSGIVLLAVAVLIALPQSVEAGLLGSLGRMADNVGDAGGAARKADGIGGTDLPASALRSAKDPNTTALALGVEPDGTLRFTDELGRAVDLPPGGNLDAALKAAANGSKQVVVVVDAKTLARAGEAANTLARRGALKFWHGKQVLPVRISNGRLSVEPRPGLVMPIVEPRLATMANANPVRVRMGALREVDYALNKKLTRGTVLVAELGKASNGPRRVGFGDGPSGKPGETATVTRSELLAGFSGNRGGTVILAGRVKDGAIRAPGGPVPLPDIRAAAAAADVHLVVLDGPAKSAHKALEQATTYGDLLSGLAPKNRAMAIDVTSTGNSRVRLSLARETRPATSTSSAPRVEDDLATVAVTAVEAGVRGAIYSIELDTRERSVEQDLSMRLIPGVPYWITVLYLLNLVLGLYGGRYAWRLWRRIWPMRPRARWYAVAHYPRFLVFALVLLPATGFIWATIAFFAGIGNTIMAVLRLVGIAKRKPA